MYSHHVCTLLLDGKLYLAPIKKDIKVLFHCKSPEYALVHPNPKLMLRRREPSILGPARGSGPCMWDPGSLW